MPAAAALEQKFPDPVRILLVERGQESTDRVIGALERLDGAYARIDAAGSLREAQARLKLEKFDLVIAELDLPDATGLAALDALVHAFGRAIAVLAREPSAALREAVMAHGAVDLIACEAIDEGAMRGLLRAAVAPAESVRVLRDSEARFRRYQEAIGRFGQAALVRSSRQELLAEAAAVAAAALGAEVRVAGEGAQPRLECAAETALPAEVKAFLSTMESLLGAGLQRIDSEGKLSFLTQFDPLTGLANRTVLTERLAQAIAQATRRGTPLAVLSIDIDDFNLVNDTLGHTGGDDLLKAIAMRLLSAVRNGDTVARVSGDQFVVVLTELGSADDAAVVARKILERLSQAFALRDKETFVTASVGIATCPGDGQGAEALISAAAAAMYRAKQSGRNGYQFFTSEIARGSRARAQLAIELRHALERNEFRLLYQPKVDLRSSRPCGAEALLRWDHPTRGMLPPAQFVPVLEETGLIVPVGEWVLARACEDIRAWRLAGRKVLPVAVNLSARQLRQQYLDRHIRSLVQSAGVEPALIEIEITESQLMEDPDHAARVMNALRDSGIRAALDDFGTGYSSLACLKRLPLATLKIDRSFVADALEQPADAAIVRAIIDMAHTLEFTVVAEGVETDAQMAFLRRFGCEQGQGFLFARPMSALDFSALI